MEHKTITNPYLDDKRMWASAIAWLYQRIREIQKIYPKVETGRGKHLQDIIAIQEAFDLISSEITEDYNSNRGLYALIAKEKGAQLKKRDVLTQSVITFSYQEKLLKDKLSTEMQEVIFEHMVRLIEKLYGKLQKKYCSGFIGLHQKTPEQYVEYLNTKTKGHHYARMLGLLLKDVYDQFPDLDSGKYPVHKLDTLSSYQFTRAEDAIKIPKTEKVEYT